jgi:hypothetical protein
VTVGASYVKAYAREPVVLRLSTDTDTLSALPEPAGIVHTTDVSLRNLVVEQALPPIVASRQLVASDPKSLPLIVMRSPAKPGHFVALVNREATCGRLKNRPFVEVDVATPRVMVAG